MIACLVVERAVNVVCHVLGDVGSAAAAATVALFFALKQLEAEYYGIYSFYNRAGHVFGALGGLGH